MSVKNFLVVVNITIGMVLCAASRTMPVETRSIHIRTLSQSDETNEEESYQELRARCIVEGRTASSDAAKAACNIVKSTCQPAKLSAEDRPTSVSLIELYGPGSIETGVNLPCDRLFQQSCTNQARRYIRRNDEDCEGILSRGPSSSTQNCTDVDHALRLLNKELETLCIYS